MARSLRRNIVFNSAICILRLMRSMWKLWAITSSLSDLKEIGCKSAWPVHISPLFWSIERLLTCKTGKICPRPAEFSLRFFKSDRLLGEKK